MTPITAMASDIRQNGFSEDPPQVVATWLRWDGIPAEASMSEPQGLHSAQLPPAFEQRHRLIRQQLTTGDLQPPASTIPEGGPKVQHLPTIADPRLSGLKRRPVVVSTLTQPQMPSPAGGAGHLTSPCCGWQVSTGMQFTPAWWRNCGRSCRPLGSDWVGISRRDRQPDHGK